jgi:trimeric autotransporter adhesin
MTAARILLVATVSGVLLASTAGAASQAAPATVTGAVTAVTGSSATLHGTVDPNGIATTWQFEYGTSTGYGSKAPASPQSAGSGTTSQAVSTALSGLTPGTAYHYRLTATSTGGTSVGIDGTFTTLPAPGVTTGSAGAIGPTQATVACSIDPNGSQTDWAVEYGQSTGYGTQTSSQNAGSGNTAVGVSVTLTGLQAGKNYHYRCVGTSEAGTARGSDATFFTAAGPTAATSAAGSIGSTTATLHGKVNPKGRTTTYFFEYGTSTSYGSKTAASSAGSGTGDVSVSKAISGLKAGATYHARLVATSDAGSASGADVSFTTQGVPVVVTGAASGAGPTQATVSGSVNPSGRATSWFVEYGTTTGYGSRTTSRSVGSGTSQVTVSATLTALQPGVLFHYRIVASNSLGTGRGGDATFATVGVPGVVTGQVVFAALAPNSARVTGTVNSHGLGTTAWVEYGRTSGYGHRTPSVQVPTGTDDRIVEFQLKGLEPGLRYHFRVVASSSAGTGIGFDKSFATPGAGTNGRRCTITGTQGADVLVGTSRADVICGLGGNDRIVGRGGNDVLSGGPGNDVVIGGDGRDVLLGGLGKDVLQGGRGDDRLEGGAGSDQLYGGIGHDTLLGGAAADRLFARDRARDVVDGGAGTDTAYVDRIDRIVRVERARR